MAENIRKVFPPVVGTSIGHWYDDTDLERYNRVIKVLLGLYTKGLLTFEKFQMIRSKLNICLVTKDEERKLNVFKQAMPGNTDWLNISGDEFARYKAVGIKIYGFSQMP